MLSYRHSFHAGNHADVLKHIVLSLIITALKKKEKPLFYLDTHAGIGRYLLGSDHAEKTGEYLQGISRVWLQENKPALLEPYLSVIRHYNPSGRLKYYPGSPLVAATLLQEKDKLLLTELHPTDYPILRHEFLKDNRATVKRADGYHQLKSQLPPLSRRGLILIDPSYELKEDYVKTVSAIREGYRRFATGCYALWYPVVRRHYVKQLLTELRQSNIPNILQLELAIRPDNNNFGMTASGMIIVNPPWKLEEQMSELFPWLHNTLAPEGYGHTKIEWIKTNL